MKFIKLAVFLFFFPSVFGIKWLSISTLESIFLEPSDCPSSKEEKKVFGFVQHQSELCRRMIELMPFVKSAADETISSCMDIFKEHRWNCSTLLKAPNFDSDLTKGTKEQAYVYALSSAAIVHQIAKACSSGEIDFCQCGKGGILIVNKTNENDLPPMDENYQWQGCSDNVEYGLSVSYEWADAPWHSKIRLSRDLTGGFLDQIEIYEMEKERQTNEKKIPNFDEKKFVMNQQNNNVGRQTIAQSAFKRCKCHGVSSSCQIQTCWNTLPTMQEISQKLKSKYLIAQQFKPKSHFLEPYAPSSDLIYIKPSSDYCDLTHERECDGKNATVLNSCRNLCCDRGHNSRIIEETQQCHCRYVHCCYVQCKKCTFFNEKSYCN